MRYAMTGATGFLGTELARQLTQEGHDVVAVVRTPEQAGHLRDLGVEMVQGDLDDAAALDRILTGADGFFHVAGWYKHGLREHDALRHVNIDGTRSALDAAQRNHVPRTVYTSTIALNSDTRGLVPDEGYRFTGKHVTEYDRTKAVAHDLALEYAAAGLPLVIVQPSVIYGPRDVNSSFGQLVGQILDGKPVLGPRGGGASWSHVEDVARGHVLAMEKGRQGECYFLAGPTATYADVLGEVASIAGKRRPLLLPVALVKLVAFLTMPLEKLVRLPQTLTAEAARSGIATYYGTSGKAERELGWSARPVADGIEETVQAELARRG